MVAIPVQTKPLQRRACPIPRANNRPNLTAHWVRIDGKLVCKWLPSIG